MASTGIILVRNCLPGDYLQDEGRVYPVLWMKSPNVLRRVVLNYPRSFSSKPPIRFIVVVVAVVVISNYCMLWSS